MFVTMERIAGITLGEWLAAPRRRDDILRVLIGAGRGLAAAHAAGVLHRDFKPANVMVGEDGRVRVVDFGLARTASASSSPPSEPSPAGSAGATASEATPAPWHVPSSPQILTRPGLVMGTPGHIAPEQQRGEPADARSDQYGYAVAAFVALTGKLPYPRHLGARAARGLDEPRTPWPRTVPKTIRHIIDRGLAQRREDRYPTLALMVAALERASSPRALRSLMLAGIGSMLALAMLGVVWQKHRTAACNIEDTVLRDAWGSRQRSAVEHAFRATGRANAGESFALVAARLDAFGTQWLSLRRDSCEATYVRGDQTEQVMALRSACLNRALAGTKALVGVLSEVDAKTLDRFTAAFPPSLIECSNLVALQGNANPLPDDPALRAEIEDVELGIAGMSSLIVAGRGPASIDRGNELLARARATGHLPLIAKVAVRLGHATFAAARTSEERTHSEVLLHEAMRLAADSGQNTLLAEISSYLFAILAYGQTRIAEAEAMLPMVEAIVDRVGAPADQKIELLIGKAAIHRMRNRYPQALELLEQVVQLSQTVDSQQKNYGIYAAIDKGRIHAELGQHDLALRAHSRAMAAMRMSYGNGHPRIIYGLATLAIAQARAGQRDAALASIAGARQLATSLPPDEPRLKSIPGAEGDVWRYSGDCARAIPAYRDALAQFTAADGPEHPLTLEVQRYLGMCLGVTHQLAEAVQQLEHALAVQRKIADTPSNTAETAFALGEVLWSMPDQRPRARSLVEEAASFWRRDDAARHAERAQTWLEAHQITAPRSAPASR
jgi:tetratricopeptide (TPR) repeat protein